jgi:hypothetical protein
MPKVPCRFKRLYISFAALKTGFLQGCRFMIGVDACFLKGRYKGQLTAAIGSESNNSMYPLSIVVVEAETKDSWTWFLEALISNLSPVPPQRWAFISDRQKVNILIFLILHLTYLFEIMYDIFLSYHMFSSTNPQTCLSYSEALYMCATPICQFQNIRSPGNTTKGHVLECYIILYSDRFSVCDGRDEKSK